MGCGVDKNDTAFSAPPRAVGEGAHRPAQSPGVQYAPGEFLRDAGIVIAVCPALAVLAQVLVMIPGEY